MRSSAGQDGVADELYRVPLVEFTAARNALAARLKAGGDKDAAAEVKQARKPSVAAWAANQVVWQAPEQWQRLQAAAQALRARHEGGGSAEELRRAARDQRAALQACEAQAASLLSAHGHAASPDVLLKVSRTLQALAYGAPGAMPGRLVDELQPPGFEALAGLTLAPPAAPPAGAQQPARARLAREEPGPEQPAREERAREERAREREKELAHRRAAISAAESRLAHARRAGMTARAALEQKEARRLAVERELEAARHAEEDARRRLRAAEADEARAHGELRALREEPASD